MRASPDFTKPIRQTGAPAPLTEVACWAHARRKIYDVHVETKSPAAAQALEMIARLFAIEADIKGRPPAERVAARRARATPILAELRAFLDATMAKISGKSSLAGAIRYAVSRWTALTRYIDDGRLEMSNNAAERAIRPLALGRKNYLFAGSDEGGRRAAIMYTLIETARLNDLDPEAWLADVIGRIADHPINRVDELLPWKWTAAALRPSPHSRPRPSDHAYGSLTIPRGVKWSWPMLWSLQAASCQRRRRAVRGPPRRRGPGDRAEQVGVVLPLVGGLGRACPRLLPNLAFFWPMPGLVLKQGFDQRCLGQAIDTTFSARELF